MAGGEQVLNLLHTAPDVVDKTDAPEMPPIKGHVALRDVSFCYSAEGPEILHNVTLDIVPGQTVALVGPTGAGKTTIANLIPRFYDVTDGAVCIDGIDARDVTQTSLRHQFGLVPQDPFLFRRIDCRQYPLRPIRGSLAAVIEAAKLANAHDFIAALPDGYRRKFWKVPPMYRSDSASSCIACAALVDPRILIQMKRRASVDTVTEVLIQEAMDHLMTGRTAVVIAHRLSTIRNADVICVIQDGIIAEQVRTPTSLHRTACIANSIRDNLRSNSSGRELIEVAQHPQCPQRVPAARITVCSMSKCV